jgi:AraC-like DNA-binding protein
MEQYLPHLSLLKDFPFFRIDQTVPMMLDAEETGRMLHAFNAIYDEYYSSNKDAFRIIAPHTRLLLEHTRRCFEKHAAGTNVTENNRTADIVLVSRVKVLLETAFGSDETFSKPHAAASYAEALHLHPNYLNAVVNRITGKSLKALIQEQVLSQAKTLLATTELSNKEIAYKLHFEEPTHFNALFKKGTGLTPVQYRHAVKAG